MSTPDAAPRPPVADPPIILVVEDSATQAAALAALLAAAGYGVETAGSAESALARLDAAHDAGRRVDLVLSDVVMPGMSGYDLCRAIKSDPAWRTLPVVLLTTLADPMDIIRGLESGADNYITKPYDPAHLLARVRHVFDNRALRRAARTNVGVDITFLGTRFTVTSEKEQILDLLVSSFEELIRTNASLRAAEAERAEAFERERAARLEAEAARAAAERERERATEANRAKSEFLAMMSHDLRTPLNAIGGYAELLQMGLRGPITEEQAADLARIRHNQAHLLALVNDVLNFARLERSEVPLHAADVPLHAVLDAVGAIVGPQVAARGLAYRYVPGDPSLVVHADRDRMEQILANLLGNAVKFTPRDGRVELSCDADDAAVHVHVRDTGIGIPPAKLDAVFDPFVQVDAKRTGTQEGVGLGLAISRALARRMGGDLSVESVVGEGSTFTLTLPRTPRAVPVPPAEAAGVPPSGVAPAAVDAPSAPLGAP